MVYFLFILLVRVALCTWSLYKYLFQQSLCQVSYAMVLCIVFVLFIYLHLVMLKLCMPVGISQSVLRYQCQRLCCVVWSITPSNLRGSYKLRGWTYCLHLKVSGHLSCDNKGSICSWEILASTCCDPEDGSVKHFKVILSIPLSVMWHIP